jgi:acetylglutamate kinase
VTTGGLTVVKFGGELLETPEKLAVAAGALQALHADGPLVVVHGGGREIDAELARRGVAKQAVDGLRITDADTLDTVVAVLAGTVNTRVVAALVTRQVRAIGLTGVDAGLGLSTRMPAHRAVDGRIVDLGLVGTPDADADGSVLVDLVALGYVPVVASLGVDASGQVLNVNADTLAAHVAVVAHARRLVIAGATAGVLDADGKTLSSLTAAEARALTADGTASAGMVAKLEAVMTALAGGIEDVHIVDGRSATSLRHLRGTHITA